MFDLQLPKVKPDWLSSAQGGRMELDGYNETRQIAFEYQGRQHYDGGRDRRFTADIIEAIKLRDDEKRRLCWARGVTLVIVPEVSQVSNIHKLLAQVELAVLCAGLKIPREWSKRRPTSITELGGKIGAPIMAKIHDAAAKRGGSCLSTSYVSSKHDLQWRCGRGHEWLAPWNRIYNGAWCLACVTEDRSAEIDRRVARIADDWHDLRIPARELVDRAGVGENAIRSRLGPRRTETSIKPPRSESHSRKIADANRGKRHSPETRERMRASHQKRLGKKTESPQKEYLLSD